MLKWYAVRPGRQRKNFLSQVPFQVDVWALLSNIIAASRPSRGNRVIQPPIKQRIFSILCGVRCVPVMTQAHALPWNERQQSSQADDRSQSSSKSRERHHRHQAVDGPVPSTEHF